MERMCCWYGEGRSPYGRMVIRGRDRTNRIHRVCTIRPFQHIVVYSRTVGGHGGFEIGKGMVGMIGPEWWG